MTDSRSIYVSKNDPILFFFPLSNIPLYICRRVRGRSRKKGMYVHIQLIHFAVQQKLAQNCKATIPQLKKNKDIQDKNKNNNCGSWFSMRRELLKRPPQQEVTTKQTLQTFSVKGQIENIFSCAVHRGPRKYTSLPL